MASQKEIRRSYSMLTNHPIDLSAMKITLNEVL